MVGEEGREEGHTGDNLNLGNAVRVAQHHTNLRGRCTLARQLGDLLFHLVRRGLEPVGGSLDLYWWRPRRCRWCPVVPVEVGSGRTRWARSASKGGPKPKYPFHWSEDDPLLCCCYCCCCWSVLVIVRGLTMVVDANISCAWRVKRQSLRRAALTNLHPSCDTITAITYTHNRMQCK